MRHHRIIEPSLLVAEEWASDAWYCLALELEPRTGAQLNLLWRRQTSWIYTKILRADQELESDVVLSNISVGLRLNSVKNVSASHRIGSFMLSLKTCFFAVSFFLSFLQSWCNPGPWVKTLKWALEFEDASFMSRRDLLQIVPKLQSLHSTGDRFDQPQEKNSSIWVFFMSTATQAACGKQCQLFNVDDPVHGRIRQRQRERERW